MFESLESRTLFAVVIESNSWGELIGETKLILSEGMKSDQLVFPYIAGKYPFVKTTLVETIARG